MMSAIYTLPMPKTRRNARTGANATQSAEVVTHDESPRGPHPSPRRCSARSSRTGSRCQLPPMRGATVCRSHGGAAAQTRAKAKRRLIRQTAEAEIASLGLSRDVDPITALMECVHEAAANVAFLRVQVGGEEQGKRNTRVIYDDYGKPFTHPVLEFYNEERDRLARYSKLAIDAGVEVRKVRLAEMQAERLAEVFDGALDDAGASAKLKRKAVEAMARRLRSLQ